MSTKSTSFLLVIWELHGDLGSKPSADVRGGKDWPSGGFSDGNTSSSNGTDQQSSWDENTLEAGQNHHCV